MAQFLLLARDRGSEMFAGLSPQDIQRIIQQVHRLGRPSRGRGPDARAPQAGGRRPRAPQGRIFNEGYAAFEGEHLTRADVMEEAIRLATDHGMDHGMVYGKKILL